MAEISASLPHASLRRERLLILALAGMHGVSVGLLPSAMLHYRTAPRVDVTALRRSHAVVTYLPALLFVGLWLYRDLLIWNVLLPGLAWRTYRLIQMLPTLITAWRGTPATDATPVPG